MMGRSTSNNSSSDNKEEEDGEDVEGDGGSCRVFGSIRNLRIYGDMVGPMRMMVGLKPCFTLLESLKIEVLYPNYHTIPIFTILDNGPRLNSVEIFITGYFFVNIVQGGDDANDAGLGLGLAQQQKQRRHYYPLEQLVLDGPSINLKIAEQSILSCPKLRVLKYLTNSNCTIRYDNPGLNPDVFQEFSERLVRLARDHCPKLQWYNFDLQYYVAGQPTGDAHLFSRSSAQTPYHGTTLTVRLCMCTSLQELLLAEIDISTHHIGYPILKNGDIYDGPIETLLDRPLGTATDQELQQRGQQQ
ncbi:hypothetical protein BGW39_008766 [Mortierella sp. 14UC]|nr:hypothetical protein BGW39_008766 [Mortierella sp. 14UC]